MVVSSLSPERCDTIARQPWCSVSRSASWVSLSVPIWLSLTRMALAIRSRMPRA